MTIDAVSAIVSALPDLADRRSVRLTPASAFPMRPVRWLWEGRIAIGTLSLLAGPMGFGKSTVGYTLGGAVTQGRLPGAFQGTAKSVLVAATEDSWSHTIVPRLVAAGADLDRVFRVDVSTAEGFPAELSLPVDVVDLVDQARDVDAGLLLLDPLLSRLSATLDTHKDAEVRRALEPLVAATEAADLSTVGIIHLNKGTSNDLLGRIMGSTAFGAVARAALFVVRHPDEDGVRLLGEPKNNLGTDDLPTLAFRIEGAHVADTDEGPVYTGRLVWLGESEMTVQEAMDEAVRGPERTAVADAADWLASHLALQGGGQESGPAKVAARKAGHSDRTLKRALKKAGVIVEPAGFPRRTYWLLPGATMTLPDGTTLPRQSGQGPLESASVGPTVRHGES
jgi:hypothetical protein